MLNRRISLNPLLTALSTVTTAISFVFSLIVSPLAALWRTRRWWVIQHRISEFELVHIFTRKQMEEEARTSLEFLKIYMRGHEQLVHQYRQARYRTLQEAQVGLALFRLAEANLMARAQSDVCIKQSSEAPTFGSETEVRAEVRGYK